VAEFGTLGPATDPTSTAWPGCRLVTVDETGEVQDFIRNEEDGPASRSLAIGRGFQRPVDVKVGPDGALPLVAYCVVSGTVDRGAGVSILAREGTGFIWKVGPMGTSILKGSASKTRGD